MALLPCANVIRASTLVIKHNITLIHLDISYCEIDHIDTQKIGKSLKHNQSIYGIHYEGKSLLIQVIKVLSISRETCMSSKSKTKKALSPSEQD